jgi:small basic protein
MNLGRRLLVAGGIFVLGIALYVLMVFIGTAFGLSQTLSEVLAFGGLIAYILAIRAVMGTGRR